MKKPSHPLKKDDGMKKVTLSDGLVFEADVIAAATGRAPMTEDLGVEHVGPIAINGAIKVDDESRTNVLDLCYWR